MTLEERNKTLLGIFESYITNTNMKRMHLHLFAQLLEQNLRTCIAPRPCGRLLLFVLVV
jgi:hypothetical protein